MSSNGTVKQLLNAFYVETYILDLHRALTTSLFFCLSPSEHTQGKDDPPVNYQPGHPQIYSDGATSVASLTCTMTDDRSGLSYLPFTHDIHVDDDVMQLAKDCSRDRFETGFPTLISGLHACGDLGSTALRLFTQVPSLHAICLVSCCYHHISERSTDSTGNIVFFFFYHAQKIVSS